MALAVYEMEHSPYCIPITAALKALGVRFRRVSVPNADRAKVIRVTGGAYYQVPVLVDGKEVVYESGPDTIDVARWVDRKHAAGRLFPAEKEGLQRILIPNIENELEGIGFKLTDPKYIDGIKDPVAKMMVVRHKERRFGSGCVERWRKEAPSLRRQLEAALQPYDLMVAHSPFLLGDEPVYADFALLGIIGNVTYRKFNRIPPKLRSLAAWEKRLRAFSYSR